MNEATSNALQGHLSYLARQIECEREELARVDRKAGELRQNIAYMEDCKRQLEEDTPKQLAKEMRIA